MGTGGFADTSNPAATLAMLQKLTLSRAPGETFEYCNTGPNIVSRIIEVLSGQDYDAFVINRVWAPLGITTPVVSSMYRPHKGEVPFYHPTRPGLPTKVICTGSISGSSYSLGFVGCRSSCKSSGCTERKAADGRDCQGDDGITVCYSDGRSTLRFGLH